MAQYESAKARRRKDSMRASASYDNVAFVDSDKPDVKIIYEQFLSKGSHSLLVPALIEQNFMSN